jgi:aminopeptidase N
MKKLIIYLLVLSTGFSAVAQDSSTEMVIAKNENYQATATRINDLVNTRLDVKFDFEKSYMYGKAWITLKPHFYATDSLLLDAKGMDIKKVELVKKSKNIPLKYDYDGMKLNINLGQSIKGGEQYTVYIDYTAKPDELDAKGSAAITDAKGLYFINPRGEEKDKPTQIWTQGETEASSVWFPTIDKPNQKTTEEIAMTVPAKFVTLSNGKMTSQKKNADGTRTDTWKMDLPHAPYLFFMGVGDYAIIKDSYKGKEVNYYVEKEYAPVAKKIFGHTPEMIGFYSKILGVEYPWVKYDQIVGRDYVSGAMENTTATLHQETAQQDARQLVDGNIWESTIAHELFHQWFGDLVTAESWSNITLNESFANYSETLWEEYKYGKDAGDAQNYNDMQGYLLSESENKDLVRFHYNDKEEVFDAVSYNKGGRVLHMLRNYVGDSAFFKALNLYLTTNKFKSAEAQQLRLAFEEVTGRDLNWYWNQWYYGAGNPNLDIKYNYDEAAKKATVIVTQNTGKIFTLPVAIDIYNGTKKTRYNVWVNDKVDTFSFASSAKPQLINFDGDKILLTTKKENKNLNDYLFQYKNAGSYLDRREAIEAAAKKQDDATAVEILLLGLKDKYEGLRSLTIGGLDLKKASIKTAAEPILSEIAANDSKRIVRAAAIKKLGEYENDKYLPLFKKAVYDSSYTVSGNALEALAGLDSNEALKIATELKAKSSKGKLSAAISNIFIKYGDETAADFIIASFEELPLGQAKFEALQPLSQFLMKVQGIDPFKKGVGAIVKFRDDIPEAYQEQLTPYINNVILGAIEKKKEAAGMKEQTEYIQTKKASKKGF